MKKIIIIIILLSNAANAQEPLDYKLMNCVFTNLLNVDKNDTIIVTETPLAFTDQADFFTYQNFEAYTHPILGVDTVKIKSLIKILDFKALANQQVNNEKWNFKKFKYKIVSYKNGETQTLEKRVRYDIAKPIYANSRNIAFIYFYNYCGAYNCSSSTVKIYVMKRGKWVYYTQMPITIS
jgi:hypothetical protein